MATRASGAIEAFICKNEKERIESFFLWNLFTTFIYNTKEPNVQLLFSSKNFSFFLSYNHAVIPSTLVADNTPINMHSTRSLHAPTVIPLVLFSSLVQTTMALPSLTFSLSLVLSLVLNLALQSHATSFTLGPLSRRSPFFQKKSHSKTVCAFTHQQTSVPGQFYATSIQSFRSTPFLPLLQQAASALLKDTLHQQSHRTQALLLTLSQQWKQSQLTSLHALEQEQTLLRERYTSACMQLPLFQRVSVLIEQLQRRFVKNAAQADQLPVVCQNKPVIECTDALKTLAQMVVRLVPVLGQRAELYARLRHLDNVVLLQGHSPSEVAPQWPGMYVVQGARDQWKGLKEQPPTREEMLVEDGVQEERAWKKRRLF